jgi:hypothetical protein
VCRAAVVERGPNLDPERELTANAGNAAEKAVTADLVAAPSHGHEVGHLADAVRREESA